MPSTLTVQHRAPSTADAAATWMDFSGASPIGSRPELSGATAGDAKLTAVKFLSYSAGKALCLAHDGDGPCPCTCLGFPLPPIPRNARTICRRRCGRSTAAGIGAGGEIVKDQIKSRTLVLSLPGTRFQDDARAGRPERFGAGRCGGSCAPPFQSKPYAPGRGKPAALVPAARRPCR